MQLTRRQALIATGSALLLPEFARARRGKGSVSSSVGQTFDFYISPTGDDSNAGTLLSPWSVTALNSKQATYTGKRVGFLPGTYQRGTAGGVQTTLYSLLQAAANNFTPVISVNGGTVGSPTYIGSSDAGGNYSPRTATIDFSNPVGGTLPTTEASCIGQGGSALPAKVGNWTWDGINVTNFTYSAI